MTVPTTVELTAELAGKLTVGDTYDSPLNYITEAAELVTDWRPALQSAIGAGGRTVVLPGLTMDLASRNGADGTKHCLQLESGTTIRGIAGSALRAADSLQTDTPLVSNVAVITDVTLCDFELDGNKARFDGAHVWDNEDEGVNFKLGGARYRLSGLYIHDCGQDAIDCDGDGEDLWVQDCRIEDNGGLALHNGYENTFVRNIVARSNGFERGAAGITNAWCVNLNHDNSWVFDSVFEDNYGGLVLDTEGEDRGFVGNIIKGVTKAEASILANVVGRVLVERNTIVHTAASEAVHIEAANSRVVGNTVVATAGQVAILHGSRDNTLYEGNVVSGGTVGFQLTGAGLHVLGNRVVTPTTFGIRFQGAATTSGFASGNFVTGGPGVQIRTSATGITVSGNHLTGAVDQLSGTNIFKNNVISGAWVADGTA